MGFFELCKNDHNATFNISSDAAAFHNSTATVEFGGTLLSIVVFTVYYALNVVQCIKEKRAGLNPEYSWDRSLRVQSIAALLVLQAAAFLVSAPWNFRPWEEPHAVCTTQAVFYLFAFLALSLEPLGLTVNLYLVVIRTASTKSMKRVQCAMFVLFYTFAALCAIIPLAIQLSSDNELYLYEAGHVLGFCTLSIKNGCPAYYVFFGAPGSLSCLFWGWCMWEVSPLFFQFVHDDLVNCTVVDFGSPSVLRPFLQAGLVFVATLVIEILVFRRVVPLCKHMRSSAEARLRVFIVRRVIVACLQVSISVCPRVCRGEYCVHVTDKACVTMRTVVNRHHTPIRLPMYAIT